jgi:hypothetical protein
MEQYLHSSKDARAKVRKKLDLDGTEMNGDLSDLTTAQRTLERSISSLSAELAKKFDHVIEGQKKIGSVDLSLIKKVNMMRSSFSKPEVIQGIGGGGGGGGGGENSTGDRGVSNLTDPLLSLPSSTAEAIIRPKKLMERVPSKTLLNEEIQRRAQQIVRQSSGHLKGSPTSLNDGIKM